MSLSGGHLARHIPTAVKIAGAVLSLIAAAFLGAYFSSSFNVRDAGDLAYKQQKISEIQQFRATGVALNSAFRAFNDALADEQEARLRGDPKSTDMAAEVEVTRRALRDSIGQHASQTYSIQAALGPQAEGYQQRLARFRRLVDAVQAPPDAMPMAQAGLNLVEERQNIADAAERRLGFDPQKGKNGN